MVGRKRDRAKRDEILARQRAWAAGQGMVEQGPRTKDAAPSPNALLAWAADLDLAGDPQWRLMPKSGDVYAWHLDLGSFRSADASLYGDCYGKQSACLDDGAGSTSCIEVEVARRLQAAGWNAGWWNTYTVPAPRHWLDGEADKPAFRALAGQHLPNLVPLLKHGGVADVIAWRETGHGLEVVAAECKRTAPRRDPFKESQPAWAAAFMRRFGPGNYAVLEWRSYEQESPRGGLVV